MKHSAELLSQLVTNNDVEHVRAFVETAPLPLARYRIFTTRQEDGRRTIVDALEVASVAGYTECLKLLASALNNDDHALVQTAAANNQTLEFFITLIMFVPDKHSNRVTSIGEKQSITSLCSSSMFMKPLLIFV